MISRFRSVAVLVVIFFPLIATAGIPREICNALLNPHASTRKIVHESVERIRARLRQTIIENWEQLVEKQKPARRAWLEDELLAPAKNGTLFAENLELVEGGRKNAVITLIDELRLSTFSNKAYRLKAMDLVWNYSIFSNSFVRQKYEEDPRVHNEDTETLGRFESQSQTKLYPNVVVHNRRYEEGFHQTVVNFNIQKTDPADANSAAFETTVGFRTIQFKKVQVPYFESISRPSITLPDRIETVVPLPDVGNGAGVLFVGDKRAYLVNAFFRRLVCEYRFTNSTDYLWQAALLVNYPQTTELTFTNAIENGSGPDELHLSFNSPKGAMTLILKKIH